MNTQQTASNAQLAEINAHPATLSEKPLPDESNREAIQRMLVHALEWAQSRQRQAAAV